MAGDSNWLDDFASVMQSGTSLVQSVSGVLKPTTAAAPSGTEVTPKQAQVETKAQLPSSSTTWLIVAAVVAAFLLLER